MAILTVGSGKQFSTIAAAVTAAQNGDTIQVQAGTYVNDYATINKNLTLQGVGGMVKMVSTGLIPNGKGILIINTNATAYDVTINNFEFSGAKVNDSNGAGIRHQAGNLVLNDCYFHNNENGVLSGNLGTVTINNSEFAYNGYGNGQSHNLYVGYISSLTINNSYFHDANVGHEIKSRALTTTITNSRIYEGPSGTGSYSIDLPDGGNALIQNNVIEQGPLSQNTIIIAYGEDKVGNPLNPGTNFVIDGNTILNDEPVGSARAVYNMTTATAQITNNAFFGLTASQIAFGPNVQTGNQFLMTEPLLDTTHPWSQNGLSIQLFADTGASFMDLITLSPMVKGTGQANTAVTLEEGGTTLGTATADSTGIWSFDPTDLSDGAHTLTATQIGLDGNTKTATLSFRLDSTAPAVSIGLVSDTGSSATDTITSNPAVKGVGEANMLVTITDGGSKLGTAMASSTGAWSFTPASMTNGVHTLTATQVDLAGNVGAATSSFTFDKTAPPVNMVLLYDTGSSSTDRVTANPAVRGPGEANTLVTIKEGGTTLGNTMAGSTGQWTFTPSGLAEGAHILTATQTDLAGNIGTATLSFTFDKTVTMALSFDTGSSATDKITSSPAVKGGGQANTEVTIKEGGATLGTTMTNYLGSWSFAPSGLADGAHALSATQTDLAGDTRTATLNFTLDKTKPAVSIALVSDTGSSSTDRITSNPAVKGHGDANTAVTVNEGGATLGTTMPDIDGNWSFTPNGLLNGAHTLSAAQIDLAGNTGTAALTYTLDSAAPAVSMALVSDTGSSSSDGITSNPALTGAGQADTVVTINEGGTTLGATMAGATGAWSFTPISLADGAHTLTASQTGVAGSAALTFTLDSAAPAVSMALVSDTGSSSSDNITSNPALTGVGEANTVVTITEGGTTLGTTMADGTGWSFTPISLADGAHTLTASQSDLAGNTGTATLSLTLDSTAPAVSIALVSDTGGSSSDNITSNPALTGVGEANTVVTINEGGTTLGTTMADGTGWSFTPISLADGAHTLTASQTDLASNTGTAMLSLFLDTMPPPVTMALVSDTGSSSTDKITSNPSVKGLGQRFKPVTITEGGTTLGTTTADTTGAWSFRPSGLANGVHTLTASQTDIAGNTGTAALSFTLDTTMLFGVA